MAEMASNEKLLPCSKKIPDIRDGTVWAHNPQTGDRTIYLSKFLWISVH